MRIKDPRFSEEKPISEDKETEESYISLIQQARHSLSNSLSVITDKSTISHLQKFEKMLLSIDSSPIKVIFLFLKLTSLRNPLKNPLEVGYQNPYQ